MQHAKIITKTRFSLYVTKKLFTNFSSLLITLLLMLYSSYGWSESAKPTDPLKPAIVSNISLSMTKPENWVVDTVHLGNRQLKIDANSDEQAAVITPLWSSKDIDSKQLGVSNVNTSKLHIYQLISASDCSQSESYFEIQIPKEYINEGKMELVFSLQAGEKGDYMFNGRKFTMADFKDSGTSYKKLVVKAVDFNEPLEKLRAIERVNFVFHRNGSNISLPIKIRRVSIHFNNDKITPIQPDIKVKNPNSFYHFKYDTQKAIDGIFARVSSEDLDITRALNHSKKAMTLTPQWGPQTLPNGHSGKVTLVQALGAIHDFERFEVQYLINIPKAYFIEGKLDVYLFIQAGETGYGRWSGAQRSLASIHDKADQDVLLRLTEEDFKHHGKKRNQIEFVGLQLNPHGSTTLEPITLRSITVKLPE